jgi:hypothetical protein
MNGQKVNEVTNFYWIRLEECVRKCDTSIPQFTQINLGVRIGQADLAEH